MIWVLVVVIEDSFKDESSYLSILTKPTLLVKVRFAQSIHYPADEVPGQTKITRYPNNGPCIRHYHFLAIVASFSIRACDLTICHNEAINMGSDADHNCHERSSSTNRNYWEACAATAHYM